MTLAAATQICARATSAVCTLCRKSQWNCLFYLQWLCCQVAAVSRGCGFHSHYLHSVASVQTLQRPHSPEWKCTSDALVSVCVWKFFVFKGPFAQSVWDDCVCSVWMQTRWVGKVRAEEPISLLQRSRQWRVASSHTSLGVMFWWVTFHPLGM